MSKFNLNTNLINPYARTGQQLARYVDEVVIEHMLNDYPELEYLFILDFRYGITEDFEKAKGGDLIKPRNIFLESGAYVSTKRLAHISI